MSTVVCVSSVGELHCGVCIQHGCSTMSTVVCVSCVGAPLWCLYPVWVLHHVHCGVFIQRGCSTMSTVVCLSSVGAPPCPLWCVYPAWVLHHVHCGVCIQRGCSTMSTLVCVSSVGELHCGVCIQRRWAPLWCVYPAWVLHHVHCGVCIQRGCSTMSTVVCVSSVGAPLSTVVCVSSLGELHCGVCIQRGCSTMSTVVCIKPGWAPPCPLWCVYPAWVLHCVVCIQRGWAPLWCLCVQRGSVLCAPASPSWPACWPAYCPIGSGFAQWRSQAAYLPSLACLEVCFWVTFSCITSPMECWWESVSPCPTLLHSLSLDTISSGGSDWLTAWWPSAVRCSPSAMPYCCHGSWPQLVWRRRCSVSVDQSSCWCHVLSHGNRWSNKTSHWHRWLCPLRV